MLKFLRNNIGFAIFLGVLVFLGVVFVVKVVQGLNTPGGFLDKNVTRVQRRAERERQRIADEENRRRKAERDAHTEQMKVLTSERLAKHAPKVLNTYFVEIDERGGIGRLGAFRASDRD